MSKNNANTKTIHLCIVWLISVNARGGTVNQKGEGGSGGYYPFFHIEYFRNYWGKNPKTFFTFFKLFYFIL